MASNTNYIHSSCLYCNDLDTDDIVQCDSCDLWFHFDCVGVDSNIAFSDWQCDSCRNAFPTNYGQDKENLSPQQRRKTQSFQSLSSVSTTKSKELALQRIEENRMLSERRDREYLRRKYSVLEGQLDEFFELGEHEHNVSSQKSSHEATSRWTQEVHNLSDDLANKFIVDNVSITMADDERNKFSQQFMPQISSTANAKRPRFNVPEFKYPQHANPFSVYRDETHEYGNVHFEKTEVSRKPLQSSIAGGKFEKTEVSRKPLQSTVAGSKFNSTYVKKPAKSNPIQPSRLGFSSKDNKEFMQRSVDNYDTATRNVFCESRTETLHADINRNNEKSKELRTSTTANVPSRRLNQQVDNSANLARFNGAGITDQHRSTFQPTNEPQVSSQQASQTQATFQPMVQSPDSNVSAQPSINQPTSRSTSHFNAGREVDYKELCKMHVNLSRDQIAMRQTMEKKYPHFYGDVTKWQMFESAFVNATVSCGLTNAENLSRLMDCLKGDAMTTVQCLLLHPSSVPGVMETLRLMFGRPEQVIQTLLDDLDETEAPEPDDLKAFVSFAILVRNLCSTVQAYNSIKHLQNTMLLKSLVSKLPTQFKLQWATYQHTIANVNLVMFSDWIYGLATVVIDVVNTKSNSSKEKQDCKDEEFEDAKSNNVNSIDFVKSVQNNAKINANSKTSKKCPACGRDFCKKLELCENFKKMNPQDRWKLIKFNNLCGCCFGYHRYFNCKQRITCGVAGCSFFHHVLLHNDSSDKSATDIGNTDKVKLNLHSSPSDSFNGVENVRQH